MIPIDFFDIERALNSAIYLEQNLPSAMTLSLPVLAGCAGTTNVAYFLYVVGGPINDRRIYAPTFKLSVPPDYPESGTYSFEEFDGGIKVPPEFPIGRSSSTLTWDAFQSRRQQYNAQMLSLFSAWLDKDNGAHVRDEKSSFKGVFDEIADTPLRPAYGMLNPDFFAWIWSP
ncbi:hypothetical protein [Roseibium sp. MMSF_3544]|uniref:hypothetical protein n=1 Tax=unclassified Roseibium TaxID=2629323 RepID=UPI0027402024|nr:hypothetical protein [Roseibium sp. MMSF_3544]